VLSVGRKGRRLELRSTQGQKKQQQQQQQDEQKKKEEGEESKVVAPIVAEEEGEGEERVGALPSSSSSPTSMGMVVSSVCGGESQAVAMDGKDGVTEKQEEVRLLRPR